MGLVAGGTGPARYVLGLSLSLEGSFFSCREPGWRRGHWPGCFLLKHLITKQSSIKTFSLLCQPTQRFRVAPRQFPMASVVPKLVVHFTELAFTVATAHGWCTECTHNYNSQREGSQVACLWLAAAKLSKVLKMWVCDAMVKCIFYCTSVSNGKKREPKGKDLSRGPHSMQSDMQLYFFDMGKCSESVLSIRRVNKIMCSVWY